MPTPPEPASHDVGEGMAISELSRRARVSVPTIKFYIREGLLPAGRVTSRTTAVYGAAHLSRLRLVRSLVELGGMSLAEARGVLAVIDDGGRDGHAVVRSALHALGPHAAAAPTEQAEATLADTEALVAGLGWRVAADAPSRRTLADALLALRELYGPVPADVLLPYATAAAALAADELTRRPPAQDVGEQVEWAVTGTIVFERVFAAWRRLAHEHLAQQPMEQPSKRPTR